MDKLTGHGRPSKYLAGEVGQHYQDLDTGNVYECRLANKYSTIHGAPVGGYLWELRAKGEDISEFYSDGSRLTEGSAPYRQLVTDGNGKIAWSSTPYISNAITISHSGDFTKATSGSSGAASTATCNNQLSYRKMSDTIPPIDELFPMRLNSILQTLVAVNR